MGFTIEETNILVFFVRCQHPDWLPQQRGVGHAEKKVEIDDPFTAHVTWPLKSNLLPSEQNVFFSIFVSLHFAMCAWRLIALVCCEWGLLQTIT